MISHVVHVIRSLTAGFTGYVVAMYVLGTFFAALVLVGCQAEIS